MRKEQVVNTLSFSRESSVQLIPFEGFAWLASQTKSFLEAGKVAISGGSTFAKLFCHWAALQPDCSRSEFFPVDERIVPFDDPQSNWGAAFKQFLKPIGRQADLAHFAMSGREYEQILKKHFGPGAPIFDVIFLGVGDDGHTASLFPGGDYLDDICSTVLETVSPKPPTQRVTLSPRVMAAARQVVAIVAGVSKKPTADRIVEADMDLPIVKVLSKRRRSVLYIEKALLQPIPNKREDLMDLFEYAKQMEKDGEKFYRNLAAKTTEKGFAPILNELADAEVRHFDVLEKMQKEQEAGLSDSAILTSAKNVFSNISKEEAQKEFLTSEIELYQKAQELEKKSQQYYEEKANEVKIAGHKEILDKMADEEKQHYAILENMIEFMSRPTQWLENAEWTHLDEF